MPYYTVRKTYEYTVDHFVEADSARDAEELTEEKEGDRNWDDVYTEVHIDEIDEEEYESYQ